MKTSPSPRTPRTRKTSTTPKTAPKAERRSAPRARRTTRSAVAADTPKSPAAESTVVSAATIDLSSPLAGVDAVRLRAYEIFLSRNGDGDALSDWLQAERELLGR